MRVLAAALVLAVFAIARPVAAWTDARPAGLVTEVQLERDGGATVTLRMRWRVLAGRFRAFEIADLPADFTLLEATASDATGNAVMVNTRTPAAGRLEVSIGEGQGIPRGAIDVAVRFTTSLRAQGLVHRVGDDAVVDISTVPWERGLEAAEIRVAIPASVRRAQWLADETPGVETTVTSELGRDVVHAIRRHVPAGARWTGHIACDPALFAWLDRPTAAPLLAPRVDQRTWIPSLLMALGLATLFALSALAMSRHGLADAQPLVPGHRSLRTASIVVAGIGGAVQALVRFEVPAAVTLGALLALVAFVLLAPRARAIEFADASMPARLWPDARALATAPKRALFSRTQIAPALLIVAAAVGTIAWRLHSVAAGVVAVDLSCIAFGAWLVLRRTVPQRDALLLASLARQFGRRFRRAGIARAAWRVRGDGTRPGSVALRVMPRPGNRFVRGVRAIECSIAWHAGAVSWHPVHLATVRVDRGTMLEKSMRLLATRLGWIETSRDGEEIAWVAEMIGPDRGTVMRALEDLVAESIAPSPGAGAEVRARTALAGSQDVAHA